MIYIKEIKCNRPLEKDSDIEFLLSDGTRLSGKVKEHMGCWVATTRCGNDLIFRQLGISDSKGFVSKIVGYECTGNWPEVQTLEDLNKVLDALLKVNRPSILGGRLNKKTNKSVKLNFKL